MRYGFAKAYAKLNLTLDVLGLRDDGYHDLESIMQSISLCDTVAVRVGCGGDISTISNVRYIPNDERNIVVKVSRAFLSATGINPGGIHIAVEKRVPSSAGMAGGSADGAAVLRLLNELTGAGLSDEELCEIGVTVGADIPFCLMGGTSLAHARGEILTPITPLADCTFVIAKPKRGMSTKAVFEKIDSCPISRHPDTPEMLRTIKSCDIRGVSENLYNVFEPVVAEEIEEIFKIKKSLMDSGALAAMMTGSGSAVFGIFEDKDVAGAARSKFVSAFDEVFIARPVNSESVQGCIQDIY